MMDWLLVAAILLGLWLLAFGIIPSIVNWRIGANTWDDPIFGRTKEKKERDPKEIQ